MDATPQETPAPMLLMIDDEPLMTDMFRQAMTKRQFQVLTASSGPDALRLLALPDTKVDLIVTDMTMPEMDGLAVAHKLYALLPDVPVLIATGHDLDEAGMGLPPNVVEVIRKPYQMRVLAERLREILAKK